ncbi:hypothetical protein [Dyella japonica]|nr:hypothetical protein [Dyella japonica]
METKGKILRDVARTWAPPLMAMLLVHLVMGMAALHSGASNPMDPAMEARWDSGHYLAIADKGYEFFSCASVPGMDPNAWCGNAGWFPGYPLMIRVASWTGMGAMLAGVVLSALFQLGTLWLVWEKLLGGLWSHRNFLCLLLAAFFPGHIYYHAVFPISVFTFFATLSLCYLLEHQPFSSGAAGALASFSYSTGFLVAPVAFAFALLAKFQRHPSGKLRAGMIAAALSLLGFAAVLALHKLEVGQWAAFFKVQAKYGHGLHNPWHTLRENLAPLAAKPSTWTRSVAPALQSALVAILVMSIVISMLWRRMEMTRQDLLLTLFTLTFWLFPLVMGGGVSIYRAEALLLPACVLMRRLPLALQTGLTVCAVFLAYPMAMLFYSSKLV